MTTKELRIGNLVQLDIIQLEVNGLFLSHFKARNKDGVEVNSAQDNITGIPLTEEWMLMLCGKKDEDKYNYIHLDEENDIRIYLAVDVRGIIVCKSDHCPLFRYKHIKNVHQLQNLYFALTGEELTIK